MLIPTVIETSNRGERAYDIYSRLLKDRIVFLGGELDETVANLIIAQLLHLEGEDMDRPVNLYINSPGGDMTALFAVYDAMQFLGPPIHTVCVGQAASAAAVLLAAGEAGHRSALPNARILIHQPHGGAQGQSVDMEIAVREMVTMRERMVDVLAERTGQPRNRIQADIDRDFILRGQDAVDYGLVDEIIEHRKPRPVAAFHPPEVGCGHRLIGPPRPGGRADWPDGRPPAPARPRIGTGGRLLRARRRSTGAAVPRRRADPALLGRHRPPAGRQGLACHHGGHARPRRQRLGRGWRLQPRRLRRRRAGRGAGDRPCPPPGPGARGCLARRYQLADRHRRGRPRRRRNRVASALVLVDVAPRLEPDGVARIGAFMLGHLDGFASLEDVADAVAAYNPHRPRPSDLSGLRKNVRQHDDGRWYWHWDPRFMTPGRIDEPRSIRNEERLEVGGPGADPARPARPGTAERRAVRGRRPAPAGARPPRPIRRCRRCRSHGGGRPQRRVQRRGAGVPRGDAPGLTPDSRTVCQLMRSSER